MNGFLCIGKMWTGAVECGKMAGRLSIIRCLSMSWRESKWQTLLSRSQCRASALLVESSFDQARTSSKIAKQPRSQICQEQCSAHRERESSIPEVSLPPSARLLAQGNFASKGSVSTTTKRAGPISIENSTSLTIMKLHWTGEQQGESPCSHGSFSQQSQPLLTRDSEAIWWSSSAWPSSQACSL